MKGARKSGLTLAEYFEQIFEKFKEAEKRIFVLRMVEEIGPDKCQFQTAYCHY